MKPGKEKSEIRVGLLYAKRFEVSLWFYEKESKKCRQGMIILLGIREEIEESEFTTSQLYKISEAEEDTHSELLG